MVLRGFLDSVFRDRTATVLGARLRMPRSHPLRAYGRLYPRYGLNLVEVAAELAQYDSPLGVVDIGANIGDSAAQICARVDARVLCVEADPQYLPYLEQNVNEHCVIESAMLVTDLAEASGVGGVSERGTTRFLPEGTGVAAAAVTVAELPSRYHDMPPIRLIKSDTDGFDTTLIPALAAAFAATRPLLFFEYDPVLTREAGKGSAAAVWHLLESAGYTRVGIWDNFGNPLTVLPIGDIAERAGVLDLPLDQRGYHYWDVAAVRGDDEAGLRALDNLFTDHAA